MKLMLSVLPTMAAALVLPACGGGGIDSRAGGDPTTLEVSPGDDFVASTTQGAAPATRTRPYTMTNRATVNLDYVVESTAPWLSFDDPANGSLTPGQQSQGSARLEESLVALLPAGTHEAVLTFKDATSREALAHIRAVIGVSNDGWTPLPVAVDAKVVYVSSSSGDDANTGLSKADPVKSLSAGYSRVRDGHPDRLLLKRGDVWTGGFGNWEKSGRGLGEPMVVSSYGSGARPELRTGTDNGVSIWGSGQLHDVAFVGLHLHPHEYDGTNGTPAGFSILKSTKRILIEDCLIEGYNDNVVIQDFDGPQEAFAIRRSVIVDSYSIDNGHSQGVYAQGVDGILLQENVFDHNGWLDSDPSTRTIFNHDVYIQKDCTGCIVRGNVFARGSSHGIQMRSGGVAEDNLFVDNPIHLLLAGGNNGNRGSASGNVIVGGGNTGPADPRGWGIDLVNLPSGEVAYNALLRSKGDMPRAVIFNGGQGNGVHDIDFHHNVVLDWRDPVRLSGTVTNVSLDANVFQDSVSAQPLLDMAAALNGEVLSGKNSFHSITGSSSWIRNGDLVSLPTWKNRVGDTSSVASPASFPDGTADIGKYNAQDPAAGAATQQGFLDRCRAQSKGSWLAKYTGTATTSWLRKAYGIDKP